MAPSVRPSSWERTTRLCPARVLKEELVDHQAVLRRKRKWGAGELHYRSGALQRSHLAKVGLVCCLLMPVMLRKDR